MNSSNVSASFGIWLDGLSHLLLGERGLKVMQVPYVKVELLPVEFGLEYFSHGIGEVGMNDVFLFMLDDPTKIVLTLWM